MGKKKARSSATRGKSAGATPRARSGSAGTRASTSTPKRARPAKGKAKVGSGSRPGGGKALGVRSGISARAVASPDAPVGSDPATSRIIRRSTIHAGKKFSYEDVVIRGDDGKELHRQMVRHPGAVTVVPLLATPDGLRVVLIRNERFAVGRTLLELPAGTLEPNEDPSVSAVRELEEEIGYTSDRLVPLGSFYTTPGLTDEIMHTYAATRLRHVGQRLEADEKITVQVVTPDEAFAMIDDGRMMDAKSMLALVLARRKGLV